MKDSIVRVRTSAVIDPGRPGGAWAAELVLGEHRRVECGYEPEAGLERLQLLGVVVGLECLTRPVSVQIEMPSSNYVRLGVATAVERRWTEMDLWDRLAAVVGRHTVTWKWPETPFADLDETATATLRDAPAVPSIGSVAAEFLADLRGQASIRALAKYDDVLAVLDVLSYAASRSEERELTQVPASQLTDMLAECFYALTHKMAASVTELADARSALPALLTWFADHGHLDAETAASNIAYVQNRLDSEIALGRFVTALHEYVDQTGPGPDDEDDDWTGQALSNGYAKITAVTADTITFEDNDIEHWSDLDADGNLNPFIDEPIGPIAIPPDVAALARTGWRILLTAVERSDGWHLKEIAGGET